MLSREGLADHLVALHGMALAGYTHAGDWSRAAVAGDLENLRLYEIHADELRAGRYSAVPDSSGEASLQALRRTDLGQIAQTLGIRHTCADVDKDSIIDSLHAYQPPKSVQEILAQRSCSARVLKETVRFLRDGPTGQVRGGLTSLMIADLTEEAAKSETVPERRAVIAEQLEQRGWSDDDLRVSPS